MLNIFKYSSLKFYTLICKYIYLSTLFKYSEKNVDSISNKGNDNSTWSYTCFLLNAVKSKIAYYKLKANNKSVNNIG